MPTKLCIGCGRLTAGGRPARCDTCRTARRSELLHRRPSSTERGYGGRHQGARRGALRQLVDGQPCVLCDQPMFVAESTLLDLCHDEVATALVGHPVYLGLGHRACNRSAGQLSGQQALAVARAGHA